MNEAPETSTTEDAAASEAAVWATAARLPVVLQVLPSLDVGGGGVERSAIDVAEALALLPEGAEGDDAPMPAPPVPDDPAVRRLRVGTEQLTTKGAAKRLKRRMKQKGVDHNVFRWT